jgi:hypothetical protein
MDTEQTGLPDGAPYTTESSRPSPDEMRERLREYVFELHRSYLGQARQLPESHRRQLPLIARSPLNVAVVAVRQLHLIAGNDALPALRPGEPAPYDECGDLSWTVRFFDSGSVPELAPAFTADDELRCVREVLGIGEVAYQLSISAGGGLDNHHAHHAGLALGNQDCAAARKGLSTNVERRS